MRQPKFWKPKYKPAASAALGPAAQEPTSSTCFSVAAQAAESKQQLLSPRDGLLQLTDLGQGAGKGRVREGGAQGGASQDAVFRTHGPFCSSRRLRQEMNFPVWKPHTWLTVWSLLNFSQALINTDPGGTTLATSPHPAPSSPVRSLSSSRAAADHPAVFTSLLEI